MKRLLLLLCFIAPAYGQFAFNPFTGKLDRISAKPLRAIILPFDGGGVALTVGATTLPIRVPFGCTAVNWSLNLGAGDAAETVTAKVWKKATGTAIPTIADVINTAGLTLSTGTAVLSTDMSDFTTTTIAANDWIMATLTAVTAAKKVNLEIGCQQ